MKKRIILALIILFMCFLLTSCKIIDLGKSVIGNDTIEIDNSSSSTDKKEETQKEKVLSIYPALLAVPLGHDVILVATSKDNKAITWSSSDTSIATIDENGRLTPVAEGDVIITVALTDDPSITDACGVLVTADGNIFLWE